MSTLTIKNIGTIFTGDIEKPVLTGPVSILIEDGKIKAIESGELKADKTIDANGMVSVDGSAVGGTQTLSFANNILSISGGNSVSSATTRTGSASKM